MRPAQEACGILCHCRELQVAELNDKLAKANAELKAVCFLLHFGLAKVDQVLDSLSKLTSCP